MLVYLHSYLDCVHWNIYHTINQIKRPIKSIAKALRSVPASGFLRFHQITNTTNSFFPFYSEYRLVIICSSKNENQSVIVRALAKFHRNLMHVNIRRIKDYLSSKLKHSSPTDTILPACTVDFDRYVTL